MVPLGEASLPIKSLGLPTLPSSHSDGHTERDRYGERERQADWLRTENDDTATEFSGSKGERERREEKGTNGEQAP